MSQYHYSEILEHKRHDLSSDIQEDVAARRTLRPSKCRNIAATWNVVEHVPFFLVLFKRGVNSPFQTEGAQNGVVCLGQANMCRNDIARWVRARIVEALKTRKRKRV